nr:ABC transporter ATP-binding protein [Candidatus Cloacimonadota bacterium]
MKIIEIEKLSLGYRAKKVIEELNLSFEAGEFCALLGPNGAGKSTLLKALIGYLPPLSGRILLSGKDLTRWQKQELAKTISLIPQD